MQLSVSNKKIKMLLYIINYCLCVASAQSFLAASPQVQVPQSDQESRVGQLGNALLVGLGKALGLAGKVTVVGAQSVGTIYSAATSDEKTEASTGSWLLGIDEKKAEAWGKGLTTGLLDPEKANAFGKMITDGMLATLADEQQAIQLRENLLRMTQLDDKARGTLQEDMKKNFRAIIDGFLAAPDEKIVEAEMKRWISAVRQGVSSGLADKKETQEMRRNILQMFPGGSALADWADDMDAMTPEQRQECMNNIPNTILGNIFNAHNSLRIAGYTSLGLGALVGTWYGVKLGFKTLERTMTKPTILLPDSHIGLGDSFKRWRSGYTTPAMIMSPKLRKRFKEIKQKTKMTAQRIMEGEDLTFDNLLLVGPPGTGKTLFGRALADSAGMYYAATTAGALLQSDQGIEHLNGLIALAEDSDRPIMLFFDEFDSFVVDRNKLDPSSQHYKVVNQFLALTGQKNKFMVVAATNHAQHLDSAIARRFHDRIDMELPTLDERKQLVELCVKQIIFNTKHNSAAFIKQARVLIQQDDIAQRIANRTEGLSHAELDNLVSAMYKKALLSRNKRLTIEHAREATHEAMAKYNQFKADKVHVG